MGALQSQIERWTTPTPVPASLLCSLIANPHSWCLHSYNPRRGTQAQKMEAAIPKPGSIQCQLPLGHIAAPSPPLLTLHSCPSHVPAGPSRKAGARLLCNVGYPYSSGDELPNKVMLSYVHTE